MIEKLIQMLSPGWVGALIGIVGLVVALETYRRSRQRAIFAYQQRGLRLLGHNKAQLPPEVSVIYSGKPIPRLTKSTVVIWNAGERTISGDDIVSSDPLTISILPNEEILSCEVVKKSREVNSVRVNRDLKSPSKFFLRFEFLDRRDGCTLEILHTGKSRHVGIFGTIKGIPEGLKNYGPILGSDSPLRIFPFKRKGLAASLAFISLFMVFLGICMIALDKNKSSNHPGVVVIAIGGVYFAMALITIWALRRRYPNSLHSDGID
jgi:hypothetical protein